MSVEDCYPNKAPKVDKLLQTLSDSVRREIIHYFENHTVKQTASLDELVAHIENRIPAKPIEDLWILLSQDHVPSLEARGWLEFDAESNVIRYHGHDEAARLLKDVLDVFEA